MSVSMMSVCCGMGFCSWTTTFPFGGIVPVSAGKRRCRECACGNADHHALDRYFHGCLLREENILQSNYLN